MLAIGIEGGGTNSTLCIANEDGHIIKTYSFGILNLYSNDQEQALHNLYLAITKSLNEINSVTSDVGAICIGSAGLGREMEKNIVNKFLLSKNYTSKIKLLNDAEIALIANSKLKNSVLVIAGTGSLAIAYDSSLQLQRCGGWGHLLDDEGSAYDIGKQALQRSLRHLDMYNEKTYLLNKIIEATSLRKVDQLIPFIYQNPNKTKIADLAKIVATLAQEGDINCQQILRDAANSLVNLTKALLNKMNFTGKIDVICHGSVLQKNDLVFNYYNEGLSNYYFNLNVRRARIPAVYGALDVAVKMIKTSQR